MNAAVRSVVVLSAALAARAAVAAPMEIRTAVEQLAKLGHVVTYSDDLVKPDQIIDVETPSLSELSQAIAPLGLQLEPVGDNWVISRRSPIPQRSARLSIRSGGRLPLRAVEALWNGREHPLQPGSDGTYTVPLDAGPTVTVRAEGHVPQVVTLSSEATAHVVLEPVEVIENVIVTGTRHRLAERSVTGTLNTVSTEELATVPSVGGDAMGAVNRLPGMSSVGVSAKPWVRGGVQDELLVRIDGVELVDAYHLADFQNLFSIVDAHAVQSVDVYTGGFPARYGNRMSGVMDITTAGPAGDSPRSTIGISVFSLLASHAASFDGGRGSYQASIRRGNLDQVLERVDPGLGTPNFYDAYGRVQHRLGDAAQLSTGALLSKDDVSVREDATAARSDIDNRYLWSRLDLDHGKGLSSTHSLSLTSSKRSKGQDDVDDTSDTGGFLRNQQSLWSLQGRSEFRLDHDGALMEFGAEAKYGRSHYDSVALIDRGILGSLLGNGETTGHDIHLTHEGWSGGVYWAVDLPLWQSWLLQPGLRWDFQRYERDGFSDQVSPRLGLCYTPTERFSMHLDAGRFFQPQEIQELQVADGDAAGVQGAGGRPFHCRNGMAADRRLADQPRGVRQALPPHQSPLREHLQSFRAGAGAGTGPGADRTRPCAGARRRPGVVLPAVRRCLSHPALRLYGRQRSHRRCVGPSALVADPHRWRHRLAAASGFHRNPGRHLALRLAWRRSSGQRSRRADAGQQRGEQ